MRRIYGFDHPVKARRLEIDEKIQPGDWYKIPCSQTLFRVAHNYAEVGLTWPEANRTFFRYEGFYRL